MRYLATLLLVCTSVLTFAQDEGSFSLVYFMTGDYEKAIATAWEAMPSIEKDYGKISEDYMNVVVALGESYRKTGRIPEMEKLYADYYEVLKYSPTDQDLISNLELKFEIEQMSIGLSQNPEQYKELLEPVSKVKNLIEKVDTLEENEDFNADMEKLFRDGPNQEVMESMLKNVFGDLMEKTEGSTEENNIPPSQSEEPSEKINETSADASTAGNELSSASEAKPISLEEIDKEVKNIASLNEEERNALEHKMLTLFEQANNRPTKIDYDRMVCYHLAYFYEATHQIEKAKFYLAAVNKEVYLLFNYMYQDAFAMAKPEEGYTDHRIDLSLFSRLFLQTTSHTNNFVLQYYQDYPSITTLMYNTFLIEKGMMLETARTMRQDILAANDPYLWRVYDYWIRTKDELVAMGDIPQDAALADSLAYISRVLKRELLRNAEEEFQSDWKNVHEALLTGEAAIEFVQFPHLSRDTFPELDIPKEDSLYESNVNAALSKILAVPDTSVMYAALVLRPQDKYPQLVPLCNQAQLNELFQRDSTGIDPGYLAKQLYVRGVGLANPAAYKGDELYELVWEPLEDLLANVQTIYFAPTGKLHQVAFAALPQQEGILLDRYQLYQVSSTRVLAYRNAQAEIHPTSATIFGGIPYNADVKELLAIARQTGLQSKGSIQAPDYLQEIKPFKPLEETATEATTISSQLEKQQISVRLYTGNQALEERFKEQGIRETPSPSILHVATHGFFVDEAATRGGEESIGSAEDALNRSGLAFAGANRFWRGESTPGLEDGILLASEVTQMNLQNTDLVVLSACETGLGQVQGSEGVFGLQRAIREAGAKYLIMSLWEVPDEETVDLMTLFYDNWLAKKQNIREAFTNAQKAMNAENAPDVWAAFVLVE